MRAIIMAGGEGTRLRPLTCNRPKPMIQILNRPVIEHTIYLLKKYNITDIVISLFYLPENVHNYFADGQEWDVDISYSIEESPLGTAGGVKQALGKYDDTFIVLSGDGLIDFDLTEIVKFHKEKKSQFTIVLTRVTKPTEYGIVITKEDGKIEKFLEKPAWSEVFTDTVNTGMYIIEPEIIKKFVPEDTKFDFSLDLFPLLQKKKIPLYGYIADGYWCDIGNLESYRDSHRDLLDGMVQIEIPGKKIGDDVWVGKNVEISPEAKVSGPVFIGDFVRIKKGAELAEFTVIGNHCDIEENASLRRSIILNSTVVGPKCELRGAIVGKRCVLEEGVSLYEGAIISDDCQLGSDVEVTSGIKVWPDKVIEQGTRLTTDLIWGQTGKKSLFGSEGITGSFNIKITPEFSAKLGSAIGAFLGKNANVVISRDTTSAALLIKRALSSGLLSMGVNVFDMQIESIPVNRYSIKFINADMGIYVQISPFTGLQYVQIRLFDQKGFQLDINQEKKIENIFFRGDYPRKDAFEVGKIFYPTHNIESYISNARNYLNFDILNKKSLDIIVDCFNGTASHVFPDLLSAFGCNVTVMRGQIKEYSSEQSLKDETRKSLEILTSMARANSEIAVMIGPNGMHLTVIDERGSILNDDDITSLLCMLYLKYKKTKTINLPVTSSMAMDSIAESYKGKVVRTSTKLRAPEDVGDIFIDTDSGRYPHLEIDYDPMVSFLLILEFSVLENSRLTELRANIPKGNIHRIAIPCNTDEKAAVMRNLTTASSSSSSDTVEMIDGVRIITKKAWVLILPDAIQPLIHLYGEGDTIETRDKIMSEYTLLIKKMKSS